MLRLSKKTKHPRLALVLPFIAVVMIGGGLYILSLVASPSLAPLLVQKPITVSALPAPEKTENRLVIPKLGINIAYAPGVESLDRGAQWRHPERGNPERGGNFIVAAHRFSIQPTPLGTIEKSPFYAIDKLTIDDKIIVDYLGTRYAYRIDKIFEVKPSQTEIEAESDTPKLTLYSCELGGSEAGRVVITATPMGKVELTDTI